MKTKDQDSNPNRLLKSTNSIQAKIIGFALQYSPPPLTIGVVYNI